MSESMSESMSDLLECGKEVIKRSAPLAWEELISQQG
jgi:hypothetical protein